MRTITRHYSEPNWWMFFAELQLQLMVGIVVWIPYVLAGRPLDYFRDMKKGWYDAYDNWIVTHAFAVDNSETNIG